MSEDGSDAGSDVEIEIEDDEFEVDEFPPADNIEEEDAVDVDDDEDRIITDSSAGINAASIEISEDPRTAVPAPAGLGIDAVRRIIYVAPEDRRTSARLSRAEQTQVIASRAKMIESSPTVFCDIGESRSAEEIARKEFNERRNPFILKRVVGYIDGVPIVELWPVREMGFAPVI